MASKAKTPTATTIRCDVFTVFPLSIPFDYRFDAKWFMEWPEDRLRTPGQRNKGKMDSLRGVGVAGDCGRACPP